MERMIADNNLAGYATFTFDYFLNGGFVGCTCSDCKSEVRLQIQIYHSGTLLEKLANQYSMPLIDELVERNIVHIKDETSRVHAGLEKYILWNMDARYEIISCAGCANKFIAIFGMAELQPGREEVQFKGIWKLNA